MGQFRYISADEVAQRHRPRNPVTPPRQDIPIPPTAVQRNVRAVLDLGDVRYITFNNHVYRIPPVPFKLGQRVLESHVKRLGYAKHVITSGDEASQNAYFREMSRLVDLLWKHIRPSGRVLRVLWWCGLTRNPFRRASEQDVKVITDFFLQGRMTSSVRLTSAAENLR